MNRWMIRILGLAMLLILLLMLFNLQKRLLEISRRQQQRPVPASHP
jgi:hypothetical protein